MSNNSIRATIPNTHSDSVREAVRAQLYAELGEVTAVFHVPYVFELDQITVNFGTPAKVYGTIIPTSNPEWLEIVRSAIRLALLKQGIAVERGNVSLVRADPNEPDGTPYE